MSFMRILVAAAVTGLSVACESSGEGYGSEVDCVVPVCRLELIVPEGPVTWRSPFEGRLTNLSQEPITVVLPGDGSESAMRTPIIAWSVLPAASDQPHPEAPRVSGIARCGNINSLQASEIIRLGPGESVQFADWMWRPSFPGPGRYRVVLYYSNVPDMEWTGTALGFQNPILMARVRASTSLALRSAEQIVTVVE